MPLVIRHTPRPPRRRPQWLCIAVRNTEEVHVSVPATKASPAAAGAEPIYVFGTDIAGRHAQESAATAVRLYGAEAGKGAGASGSSYAIPYRNSEQMLLPLTVIRNYLDDLFKHAAALPGSLFHVARFGCEPGAYKDAELADLFRRAPGNVILPGLWARLLDPKLPARLLIFDPGAHMKDPAWQDQLRRYLALNVPLWNTPGIELVSVGDARAVVANDLAARQLKLKHRVIGANEERYGRNAQLTAEYRAVWYATHVLSIFDFDLTAQPQQIRIMTAATRGGLVVDQLDAKLLE